MPPPTLEEKPNPYMNWETVNPEWWVPRGYAACASTAAAAASRRASASRGRSPEAIDFYDAIEWAAAQPWCNGKVGLSGISYFAINQWFVANLQPPSLEGDHPVGRLRRHLPRRAVPRRHPQRVHDQLVHRAPDASRPGPRLAATARTAGRPTRCGTGCTTISTAARCAARRRSGTRSRCRCYTVGNWTGFALHLRGNTEAFMRAASKHKKLRIHTGTHVHPFYTEEGRRDQLRFFDYWLKGIDNGVMDEPPVKLAIRKGSDADRMARTSTSGRSRARNGPNSISTSSKAGATARSRASARWRARSRQGQRPAPIRRSTSARWARPRRPRRR